MKNNTNLKIVKISDLSTMVEIAKKLTEVRKQLDKLKASEKAFVDQLKKYMVDNNLCDFENFELVEKKNEEVLPSEYIKYVSQIDFIKSVKVIKSKAKKYIGSEKLKKISIENKPSYSLNLKK
jgi:hypothetical protein